jgi:hypothetical protein
MDSHVRQWLRNSVLAYRNEAAQQLARTLQVSTCQGGARPDRGQGNHGMGTALRELDKVKP